MPFPMKVQPLDEKRLVKIDPAAKPTGKSRLKRLFERQFRISCTDKLVGGGSSSDGKEKERDDALGSGGEVEPSSVCLDKMVISFLEDGHGEKPQRGRCNCFNGNHADDSSDDELDFRSCDNPALPSGDAAEVVKGLALCTCVVERNILADATRIIVEKTKNLKGKDDCRKVVVDGLCSLGYNASVCKSRWDKSPSFPAGEYEYIDVIMASTAAVQGGSERLILDVDFRSEFEIARSTKTYRTVLQHMPGVFVGSQERLQQIVSVAAEAARQSLKKKGLHVPPWRKPEYMRAKWLSPYQRTTAMADSAKEESVSRGTTESSTDGVEAIADTAATAAVTGPIFSVPCFSCGFEVGLGGSVEGKEEEGCTVNCGAESVAKDKAMMVQSPWRSPAVRPMTGVKVVTGLSSVLRSG